MQFTIIPVTPFQQNCSLLRCEASGKGAVIDPGGDLDRIVQIAQKHEVTLEKIFLTHGHVDHCGRSPELAQRLGIPIEGPQREDEFWIKQLPMQAEMFGFPRLDAFTPDRWLEGGDKVQFGEITLEVRHCPGHTPGHVVYFEPRTRTAFVGDVLFQGSVGRTDFPRSDHDALINAIRKQLWPLGDDVQFVPGHGPMSTFGEERRSNPYVWDGAHRR